MTAPGPSAKEMAQQLADMTNFEWRPGMYDLNGGMYVGRVANERYEEDPDEPEMWHRFRHPAMTSDRERLCDGRTFDVTNVRNLGFLIAMLRGVHGWGAHVAYGGDGWWTAYLGYDRKPIMQNSFSSEAQAYVEAICFSRRIGA